MPDLLPPNATDAERALATTTSRYGDLPVIIRQLWNPDRCPAQWLGYLAYAFSVEAWDDGWPEHIKRQTVKDALYQHRIKGSLQAVLDAVASFGTLATVTEWWQRTPRGEPHTFSVDISAQDNERPLPVYQQTGDTWLYTRAAIPVATSRVYRMRFKVRQTVDDDGSDARVYAGVATLGSQFENLTGGAGTHRYCCVSGQLIRKADGWQVFEGEISGIGDTRADFRPGTVYVRPMFIVNYKGGSGTAQVAEVEFWDLFDNKQLISNPHFTEGKKGWSRSYVGETVPENAPGNLTTAAFRPDQTLQADMIDAIHRAKPVRSLFSFNVGTVHPGTFHLRGDVHQVALSRATWE